VIESTSFGPPAAHGRITLRLRFKSLAPRVVRRCRIIPFVAFYMVIERFKNGDPVPIYRRVREQGR